VTEVEFIDGTVHRAAGDVSPRRDGSLPPDALTSRHTVHALLRHLRERGIDWVPEPLGFDKLGREVLSFLPGEVPAYPMPDWVWTETALIDAASKLREIHDASVDFSHAEPWRGSIHEPQEVICHTDFAPHNLAFEHGRVTGVIEWDYAAPGPRIWDVAYLAYRIVPRNDRDAPSSQAERMTRLQLLLDSYGTELTAASVIETATIRLEDLAEFSERESVIQNRPELVEHAALYRRDAESLRS
jgi:Phosphotransferase enzyme family